MTPPPRAVAEIAFTASVRDVQEQQGSAAGYAKVLSPDADGGDALTERDDRRAILCAA